MARYRIHAGTDIACVGIWDAGLPSAKRSIEGKALEESAARGEVLTIDTSADGSYLLQIHVDEPFVPAPWQRFATVGNELGLHLGSGTAMAGGCEDFRNPRPQITSAADRFHVEPSWYRVRVHLDQMEGSEDEQRAHEEASRALTSEELARYQRLGKSFRTGWLLAVMAGAGLLASVFLQHRLVPGALGALLAVAAGWRLLRLKRSDYDALHLRYEDALAVAVSPDIVLELHREPGPLPGGSVSLEGPHSS
ncbi:hypothetical protein EJ065_4395 [Corallococcus coralloides]|uniref:Uncharacterized protein n=1 Tax=Corallococcus coralloides TaxID=184914 RepID=A0A410RVP1_CORCK|nr:hypothetical protein [Corallococcus coralloides]QAT85947.1 hypothetical protein EJ065_4395 [Corallococcus coralloides]